MALLASCQPLPHPFADDRPPRELLAIPESVGVSIAPVEGQPKAIAAELGPATARALLRHEIPASHKSTGNGSYHLHGRLIQSEHGGKSAVAVLWRLDDAKGRRIGEREARLEAPAGDWREAGGAMVERLAALSADEVARLLVKDPAAPKLAARAEPGSGRTEPGTGPPSPQPPLPRPPSAKPAVPDLVSAKPPIPASPAAANPPRKQESARTRVIVRRVTGAPGDGDTSLVQAVASVLRQQNLAIIDPGGKADFTIDGEVSIAPVGPDKQHVKIVWRVRNASGAELGTVGQENDVPRGLLSGSWGDVAHAVAASAGDGLMQVFARAAPPTNPAPATGAATASKPKAGRAQPASDRTSRPAAAAAKTAKTKGRR